MTSQFPPPLHTPHHHPSPCPTPTPSLAPPLPPKQISIKIEEIGDNFRERLAGVRIFTQPFIPPSLFNQPCLLCVCVCACVRACVCVFSGEESLLIFFKCWLLLLFFFSLGGGGWGNLMQPSCSEVRRVINCWFITYYGNAFHTQLLKFVCIVVTHDRDGIQ